MTLPRQRPDIVPALHPVPEYLADGDLKQRYDTTKSVFQVPWMGVVAMAFAHYRAFYGVLWDGLAPLCASRAFVDGCRDLRALTETRVAVLQPPSITARLRDLNYAPREIDAIRAVIEIFSHGNFPYIFLATVARHLLEGGEMRSVSTVEPFTGRHAPDVSVPFVLMEAHHADAPTRAVFEDLKAKVRLPFVNTDYRALARWPSYFALAWNDLRDVVGAPTHEDIARAVHERALAMVSAFPNPGGLSGAVLRAAAAQDGAPDDILNTVRLFQWLLPALATNVAFFRHQLAS